MKRSLISLAALAASAHAAAAENIVGASTAWPNTGKKPIEDSKIHIDLDPIVLPLLKGNDEKFGIPDGDGITQWPETGRGKVRPHRRDSTALAAGHFAAKHPGVGASAAAFA